MNQVLFLGSADSDVARLAAALGIEVTPVPGSLGEAGDPNWSWGRVLDDWRGGVLAGGPVAGWPPPVTRRAETGRGVSSPEGEKVTVHEVTRPDLPLRPVHVVVAVWAPVRAPRPVIDLDLDTWVAEVEAPLAGWVAALGVTGRVVADGGTVVAVVERPSPLDCAGHGPEAAVSDAVEALVRSLARSEGPRGVRVTMVTTPARTAPEHPVAPPPPLATFPGTVEDDVAGAVRMLLGADAAGLTGTVVHADAGRSWR